MCVKRNQKNTFCQLLSSHIASSYSIISISIHSPTFSSFKFYFCTELINSLKKRVSDLCVCGAKIYRVPLASRQSVFVVSLVEQFAPLLAGKKFDGRNALLYTCTGWSSNIVWFFLNVLNDLPSGGVTH